MEQDYFSAGIPGINLNIWEIALKTVRMCLQTLLVGTFLEKRFPQRPTDHLLVCNKPGTGSEEIFTKEYDMKYMEYPRNADCSICGDDAFNENQRNGKLSQDLPDKYIEQPNPK